jgi:hypothetical protein
MRIARREVTIKALGGIAMRTDAHSSWRELAEAAYKEHDSKRLMDLISRLKDALDDCNSSQQDDRRHQAGAARQNAQCNLYG